MHDMAEFMGDKKYFEDIICELSNNEGEVLFWLILNLKTAEIGKVNSFVDFYPYASVCKEIIDIPPDMFIHSYG